MKDCPHMKLRILTISALFFTAPLLARHINYSSQTYMFPRPLYHNIAAIWGVWDDVVNDKAERPCGSAFQAMAIFQESVRSFCKPNGYFSINCKQTMIVAGDSAANTASRDIRAEWLGLSSTFSGTLSLHPQQYQAGALLSFNQNLGPLFRWDFLKSWWLDFTIPIFKVRNRIATPNSSPEVLNALNGSTSSYNIAFAKIINCNQDKTGVGTIEIKLGGTFLDRDGFLMDYYTGVGLPAESKPCPNFLFAPSLGNNEHLVVINGGHLKIPIFCCEDFGVRLFFEAENRYYIHNYQFRTFDLNNCVQQSVTPATPVCEAFSRYGRPFSRYLPVRQNGQLATIPAANVLTFCVRVDPRSFVTLATGFEFASDRFVCEIAYLLWGHDQEQIGYHDDFAKTCCAKTPPAYLLYGIADTTAASTKTASLSTISTLATADATFTPIQTTDIDRRSAGAGGALVQGLHVGFYGRNLMRNHNAFVGIGAFIEVPDNNAAFENWGIWGKIGMDF